MHLKSKTTKINMFIEITRTNSILFFSTNNISFRLNIKVIFRRIKGDVLFNNIWSSYENGFGNLDGDFWQGIYIDYTCTCILLYHLLCKKFSFLVIWIHHKVFLKTYSSSEQHQLNKL